LPATERVARLFAGKARSYRGFHRGRNDDQGQKPFWYRGSASAPILCGSAAFPGADQLTERSPTRCTPLGSPKSGDPSCVRRDYLIPTVPVGMQPPPLQRHVSALQGGRNDDQGPIALHPAQLRYTPIGFSPRTGGSPVVGTAHHPRRCQPPAANPHIRWAMPTTSLLARLRTQTRRRVPTDALHRGAGVTRKKMIKSCK
jgi:hypothetical protein